MKPNATMRLITIYSCCFLSTCWSTFGQTRLDGVAIKVNDEMILHSQIESQYQGGQSEGVLRTRCEVVQGLVMNKLLLSGARQDSIEVSDEEVEASLDRRMAFFIAQVGSEALLESLYGKSIRALKAEFRTLVKEQLLAERKRVQLTESVSIAPVEVQQFFNALSESERPYYSTEVELGQIVREIQPGQEANLQTLRRLMELRRRISAGEAFDYIARRYSMDPSALSNNGTLGFVRRGSLAPNYEAAALNLSVGALSMPVKTAFGYHLIELIERRGTMYNTRHILLIPEPTEADEARIQAELDSLRRLVVNQTASFESLAADHSDDLMTSRSGGYFLSPTGAKTISVDQIDPMLFFTIDTMQIGTLSRPLPYRTPTGKKAYRVLYYKRKIPPHQATLSQDYPKIREAALAQKKEKEIKQWVKRVQKEAYIQRTQEYAHCDLFE